jgi:hypothetical protein
MRSMRSKGWEFSSADVGVFTNHQSKEVQCVKKDVGVENFQPLLLMRIVKF